MSDFPILRKPLRSGVPCSHPGCLHHVTHPCEGCGRVAGIPVEVMTSYDPGDPAGDTAFLFDVDTKTGEIKNVVRVVNIGRNKE